MASKKGLAPAPRQPDPAIAAAIGERPPSENGKVSEPAGVFQKLSISVSPDVAQQLRVLAVVEHRVSESAVVEAALRAFLLLPKEAQGAALTGYGRRRKNAGTPKR